MIDDFLYRDVPALGRRVFRLGLATHYGIGGEDLEWALEQGVNYIFWTPTARRVTKSLKAALKRDRESLVLAWSYERVDCVHDRCTYLPSGLRHGPGHWGEHA